MTFVEDAEFTRAVGEGSGVRARDLSPARLEEVLTAHDDALASDDERVAKRARKSVVTRHGDLVVKESLPFGLVGHLKDRLAPRRHAAGFLNARRLLALDIATARPLAWLRRRGRVFTLYDDLSALERLDLASFRLYDGRDLAVHGRLRNHVAEWLGDLHARGVYHGDLKGSNVLLRDGEAGFSLPLIDTDRVRFFDRRVDDRRRVKNLAQLAASLPVSVTRAERLRFYRTYAAAFGAGPTEQWMAREVATALAKKRLVIDHPIE